jgi:hypothetical protein
MRKRSNYFESDLRWNPSRMDRNAAVTAPYPHNVLVSMCPQAVIRASSDPHVGYRNGSSAKLHANCGLAASRIDRGNRQQVSRSGERARSERSGRAH